MPTITQQSIQMVIEATDFVSLVENYTHLEQRSHVWWGCCPFHSEKTPSFHIDPEKKVFYCFGCQKGGTLIQFFMEMEHISFIQAVTELAKKNNVSLVYENGETDFNAEDKRKEEIYLLYEKVANSFHHILLKTKEGIEALKYLEKRCVSNEIIDRFCLGFAPAGMRWLYDFLQKKGYTAQFLETSGLFSKKRPKFSFFSNRIMFPIFNRQGQVIAFGGRALTNDDPKNPKYLNSYDMIQYQKKENLFGLYQSLPTIRKERSIILCEGYMDVLAFHQAGITNACAPLGTALTEEQVKILSRLVDTVYLCFDTDQAGVNATFRAIDLLLPYEREIRILTTTDAKDPGEVFEKNGAEGLKNIVKNGILDSDFFVQKAMTEFDILTAEGKTRACNFLFPYLNRLTSQIKREAIIQDISRKWGISAEAMYSDFTAKKDLNLKNNTFKETKKIAEPKDVERNFETLAILAVAANQGLFKTMRSQLSTDDFTNPDAKEIFIALEECYREQNETYEELLKHCPTDRIKNAIISAVFSGEFSTNPEEIINDSIKKIKLNKLSMKRASLVHRLDLLPEEVCFDIQTDIADLDRQIDALKK
ncbi:MAG: DNA primase [Spirochaetaceae bacterium]|nr:DNA primase [Spirochaetaceae bacterium]